MPLNISKVVLKDFDSYCSAPPLTTTSRLLLQTCPKRAEEARCQSAPLRVVEAEVTESSVEGSIDFAIDAEDIKPDVKIEADPSQWITRVAAISIRQASSAVSTSSEEAQAPSTSSFRTQPLCRVPPGQLGPADPPRRPGRPKGSKSRPRIEVVHGLPVPPVRKSAAKAQSVMTSKPNRS